MRTLPLLSLLVACTGAEATDEVTTPTPRDCEATHPSVGLTAELQTFEHGVTGTAEIIDDCTVEITGFGYDGTGLDVRLWGALGGDWDSGFSMSEDLLKEGGYDNDVLIGTLPLDRTWDDADGVSVWCVDVGIDFGSALF